MGYGDSGRIQTRSGIVPVDLELADVAALTGFIDDLNDQASEMVDSYCGRDFEMHGTEAEPVLEMLDGTGHERIRLAGYPVLSLSSVTLNSDNLAEGLNFAVLAKSGLLERIDHGSWTRGKRNVAVEYTYGYVNPPGAIVLVVEEMVTTALLEAKKNWSVGGALSASMDGYTVAFAAVAGFLNLTSDRLNILDRYRVATGA